MVPSIERIKNSLRTKIRIKLSTNPEELFEYRLLTQIFIYTFSRIRDGFRFRVCLELYDQLNRSCIVSMTFKIV